MEKNSVREKYLREIEMFEAHYGHLDILLKYIKSEDSDYIRYFCDGTILLPSPNLILKISSKLQSSGIVIDTKTRSILTRLYYFSKQFYDKFFSLIDNYKSSFKISDIYQQYEKEFGKTLQPIGQKLINFLKAIKYRILLLNKNILVDQVIKPKIGIFGSFGYDDFLFLLAKPFVKIIYLLSLVQAANHKAFKGVYSLSLYISALFLVYSFFTILLRADINSTTLLSFNLSIIGTNLSWHSIYPITDFRKKDIYGKNMIAYKYKLFIKHLKENNAEMYYSFLYTKKIV
jgi:hypothetical protein